MTENPHLDICSKSVVLQSVGGVRSRRVLLFLRQKPNSYMALASATQEAVWLEQLTADFGIGTPAKTIVIFEDNQSAISMTKNPQFHGRSKHIAIKYHFVRDQVGKGTVKLEYCPTKEMVADILTKGLPKSQFVKLRLMAGITTLEDLSGNE